MELTTALVIPGQNASNIYWRTYKGISSRKIFLVELLIPGIIPGWILWAIPGEPWMNSRGNSIALP